jgi:cytochrome c oxidase assembly protein subunit 15
MMTTDSRNTTTASRLPLRLATLLVCAVFPLIWIGGLVTSRSAGMAVPDWPNTYGYNLFLYPLETWIEGSRDIFIEHGHRLFAAVVGMLTIALVVAAYRSDLPPWLRRMAYWALALVLFQGVLGGLRVVLAKETLAMVHGCVGPLFFVYCVAMRHFIARSYAGPTDADERSQAAVPTGDALVAIQKLHRLAIVTSVLAYVQLVLGAVVRHTPHMAGDVTPSFFRAAVLFHLFMAAVLTVHIVQLAVRSFRASSKYGAAGVSGPAVALLGFIVVQLLLGVSTWVVNYGFPQFAARWSLTPEVAIEAQSFAQLVITTAHVAVGSLIVAVSTTLALHARVALLEPRSVVASSPVRSTTIYSRSLPAFGSILSSEGAI